MYLDVLNERQGFGKDVTGGKDGPVYVVTTTANEGPGSLRAAWEADGPAWIQFGVPGTWIGPYTPKGNKTLDARKFPGQVQIAGTTGGAKLDGANNTIILGVNFDMGWDDWKHDNEGSDGLQVRNTSGLWVHKCRFAQWSDGLIDLKENVSKVSVTWCLFEKDYQAFLWCGKGVTLAYCRAINVNRRFAKSVGGLVHSYNNLIEKWGGDEIQCAKDKGELLSEYNLWVPGSFNRVGSSVTGGKIQNVKHKAYGSVAFAAGQIVSAGFLADARACAKITKPVSDAEWKALRDKLVADCGVYKTVTV